jgi:integrase
MNMKQTTPAKASDAELDWQKTSYSNLIRYVPSGTYFARIRVKGKLIRRSLKTKTLSVAKLRLADLEKDERKKVVSSASLIQGKMTFGDVLADYKLQRENDPNLKAGTVEYDDYRIKALLESWPDLKGMDVSKISASDCKSWSEQNAKKVSSSSHNHTVGILRRIFKIAIEAGARYDNPALAAKRVKEHTSKHIKLPEPDQFEKLVTEIRNSGSGFAEPAGNLVQFLAYGGFRKSEAANITWVDCDFKREKIILRGDPVTGLKRRRVGEFREVPMIPEMRKLLEQIREKRPDEALTEKVMRVFECQKSLDTACKKLGIPRFTHHDLRHLFATRSIESGVDIPTVSRWLGHKDGGAEAMKTYGHLRDEHSTTMAQKVVFVVTPTKNISAATIENLSNDKPADAKHLNKVIAQTKAKYAYPWWASNNPTEVFWGQINEKISIVSFEKYHAYAEKAMGRPIFTHEFGDPQALIDEFVERISKPTLEDILKKIPAIKQKAA